MTKIQEKIAQLQMEIKAIQNDPILAPLKDYYKEKVKELIYLRRSFARKKRN